MRKDTILATLTGVALGLGIVGAFALGTAAMRPTPAPIRGHGYALTVEYGGNAYVEDSGLTLEDCARDAVPMAKAKPYAEVLCVPIRTESE